MSEIARSFAPAASRPCSERPRGCCKRRHHSPIGCLVGRPRPLEGLGKHRKYSPADRRVRGVGKRNLLELFHREPANLGMLLRGVIVRHSLQASMRKSENAPTKGRGSSNTSRSKRAWPGYPTPRQVREPAALALSPGSTWPPKTSQTFGARVLCGDRLPRRSVPCLTSKPPTIIRPLSIPWFGIFQAIESVFPFDAPAGRRPKESPSAVVGPQEAAS